MSCHELLAEAELWVGEHRRIVVGERRVIVLRTEAGVFAYEDRCPHLGLPLSKGTLEGQTLTCYAHHFQFDAETGEGINPRCLRLWAYPVEHRAGMICVDFSRRVEEHAPLSEQPPVEDRLHELRVRREPLEEVVDEC
jgi:toluene monooxygenase system ferredoxin subunit